LNDFEMQTMKTLTTAFITTPSQQRGAAALIVTSVLFFAMALTALFVNRNLVFEQRSATNQYRSTLAFEAAEAGLEWALAQLNNPQALKADCLPTNHAADSTTNSATNSFRTRYLKLDAVSGHYAPSTWNTADGRAAELRPSCVQVGSDWSCSCPTQSEPALRTATDSALAPAFSVRFLAAGKPGLVRVVSTGCTSWAGACASASSSADSNGAMQPSADATAQIEITLALLPGLRTAPVATLTTRGAVQAVDAALGIHNTDSATALSLHAGGTVQLAQARVSSPAGAPRSSAWVTDDKALASLSTERFFASYFGVNKASWQQQPAVTRVMCTGNCSSAVNNAIQSTTQHALIWLEGDITLSGPITLGSAERPALIVVNGAATLEGAVAITGVIYANALRWDDASTGATVHGAAVSESSYRGSGEPELFYDPSVLAQLTQHSGNFVRVSGSWRDF
jgi:hypothetical protein